VQEPRSAESATGSVSWHALYATERRRAESLQAQVVELERARDQLQIYAEDLRRTHAELRRWITSLNALHDVSTSISSALDEQLVLERLLESVAVLVPSDSAAVYLAHEAHELRLRASDGRELRMRFPNPQIGQPPRAAGASYKHSNTESRRRRSLPSVTGRRRWRCACAHAD